MNFKPVQREKEEQGESQQQPPQKQEEAKNPEHKTLVEEVKHEQKPTGVLSNAP